MNAPTRGRYLPVRSRCLHPGQQQGRRGQGCGDVGEPAALAQVVSEAPADQSTWNRLQDGLAPALGLFRRARSADTLASPDAFAAAVLVIPKQLDGDPTRDRSHWLNQV
jgi:hypothetical protein